MTNSLEELFDKINEKITNGGKLKDLSTLLEEYNGVDWKTFCKYCDVSYKRNIVKKNDNMEMLIICWNKNQKSGIHDHPENGCLLKILNGFVREDEYIDSFKGPKKINSHVHKENAVSYKEGKKGLHDIINVSGECVASLHIYSPPNYKPHFY